MLVLAETKERAEEIACATEKFKIEAEKGNDMPNVQTNIVPEGYYFLGVFSK